MTTASFPSTAAASIAARANKMKALIAMSGGVDSSVAAFLIRQKGVDAIGCMMKLFSNEAAGLAPGRSCCSLDDSEDARAVAFRLGMPFYVFNYQEEFRREVMERFAKSYAAGLTPNPCIDCHRFLKFGALYERARLLGCDFLVTGHYARIEQGAEGWLLKKALAPEKDQSYVLYELTQEQLAHSQFPLGGMCKAEVRALAETQGFLNAKKPDSQDICFVPDGDHVAVIERLTGQASVPGDFVDRNGHVYGRHRGIAHYTVGQHRGLELFYHEALYVISIDPVRNTVVLGPKEALYSDAATVGSVHWICGKAPERPFRCTAKIRYRAPEASVTVTPLGADRARLQFDQPQRAITPGQAAVLYDGETVLGGGRFERS